MMDSFIPQDNALTISNAKGLLPLKRQCALVEQALLRALRSMHHDEVHQNAGMAMLASLGLDVADVATFVRLRLSAARHGPQLQFLAVDAPFVCRDELDLLASLKRLASTRTYDILLDSAGREHEHPTLLALLDAASVIRRTGLRLRQTTPPDAGCRILEHDVMRNALRRAAGLRLQQVRVARNRVLSPALRRITLAGATPTGFLPGRPAQWLKLYAPMCLGDLGDIGRAYTIRAYRPDEQEVDIDIALHGRGPLTTWAADAWEGQSLAISGARGGYTIAPGTQWLLLAGDVTALPALSTILESLPQGFPVRVCVNLSDASELELLPVSRCAALYWMVQERGTRAPRANLQAMVASAGIFDGVGQAWIAGEASVTTAVGKYLMREVGMDAASVHTFGFWKRGVREYKDMAVG